MEVVRLGHGEECEGSGSDNGGEGEHGGNRVGEWGLSGLRSGLSVVKKWSLALILIALYALTKNDYRRLLGAPTVVFGTVGILKTRLTPSFAASPELVGSFSALSKSRSVTKSDSRCQRVKCIGLFPTLRLRHARHPLRTGFPLRHSRPYMFRV